MPAAVRVVIVARDADLWVRRAGVEEAVAVVRRRSSRAYDPVVAAAFVDDAAGVLDAVASADSWQTALDAEPPPWLRISEDRLDAALSAFGDFADLKSPWLRGHSSAGLEDAEVIEARRAALLHDVGRVVVPNGVWDYPGTLTTQGWEKARLHTYFTERVLVRARRLAPLARLALGIMSAPKGPVITAAQAAGSCPSSSGCSVRRTPPRGATRAVKPWIWQHMRKLLTGAGRLGSSAGRFRIGRASCSVVSARAAAA